VTHWEGEHARFLELVISGVVRVFVTAPDGRTMTIRYCRPGALIGAASLFAQGYAMPAPTQALVDAELLRMSPTAARRAAERDPRVATALLGEVSERVLSFVWEISGSAFATVRQRVARHLLDLASERLPEMFDASFPEGWWYYFRSCDVATLTDEVIDITAEHAQRIRSPLTAFPIFHLGGAVGRVGDDETAFHGRTAGHAFNINATTVTRNGFEEEREWSRSFWSALRPYHTGVYVNFLMDEGQQRVRDAYGSDKYDRLRALKRKYDPDNFFRMNQNIPPA
jgi:CRP-like cAMP-binding protein